MDNAFSWDQMPEDTANELLRWIGEQFGGEWAPMDEVVYQAVKIVKKDGSGKWAIVTFVDSGNTLSIRYAYEIVNPHPGHEDIRMIKDSPDA